MTGTVFDIGYRSYTGGREGRARGRRAVFKDGVRTALGLGRGARAKILPWIFIGVLSAIALVMAMVAGAVDRIAGPGGARQMELPSHGDYYGIAASLVFVFGAIVAPELLCRDRREGVINLYLVRPLTGSDYVVSRWSAFFVVMLASVWLPQFILFAGLCGGDAEPVTYFLAHWLDIPRFLLAGLAMTLFVTSLALLTASFTTRRAYAAVFLVGLFVISTPFTVGLSEEIGGKAGQWISMFTLSNIPVHVNDVIFGEVSELTEDAPARLLPPAVLVGWYLAWTLIPAVVLWWRYRRLTP
ncbi:MAG: ABC transporter permease subunit [Cytophagaceae bacterium]|nr:ABC transporter permease subunit [Gemmatimonadaceae bacterium]